MQAERRLVVASAIAVVLTAAFLPSSGLGSSAAAVRGAQWVPAGLANAIHARLGAGAIGSISAAHAQVGPAHFGFSVALSGDGTTALVGAPDVRHSGGAAYIFHASGAGSWSSRGTPTAALTKTGLLPLDGFGFDVALSADGTTAFVGAPGYLGNDSAPGAIYVFHVSAENAWASTSTPTATLTASGGLHLGYGALAVAPDGTTLVAGAPDYNGGTGGAHVFHVASESAWASTSTPTATLSNADQPSGDYGVGFSVAISGDGTTALVSDAFSSSGGGAYVYHVSADDAWASSSTPTALLFDGISGGPGDLLGVGLALSGDGTVAFLGAPRLDASGGGYVDVFHASGEAAWASTGSPTATLTKAGGSKRDVFGFDVAVSTDGTTALVHASGHAAWRGAAYVYRVSDEGAWASSSAPTATLTRSGVRAKDILRDGYDLPRDGAALSADGATALVGVPGFRFGTGAASVFHVADASSWASSATPRAILTDSALVDCVVPKLNGLKVSAARAALKAASCRLGKVSRVHATAKRGRVVSQSAKPQTRLPQGAKIKVKIAK
jgi:hypothetical protein